MDEKSQGRRKITFSKKTKFILSVLLVVVSVLMIVFTAAQTLGGMTVSSMADSVKAFFLSLGAGDGYPYSIDASSVVDVKIENSNIYLLLNDKTIALNQTAKEIMPEVHTYSNPAMKSENSKLIIYDLDSDRFRIQNGTEVTYEGTASGRITSAAIGKKGNYALGTYGNDVQSVLTVYSRKNEPVFIWNFKTERIVDIALSDNGKYAAVAVIDAQNGEMNSKLYVFDFKSKEYVSCFDYAGTTLAKVDYIKGENIVAVGDNIRSYISKNTQRNNDIDFESDVLYNYCITDKGRTALGLSRYGSTSLSKLTVYSDKNEQQFTLSFDKEMKWADCDDKYTAVLFENEVKTFNKKGEQVGSFTFTGEPLRVMVDGSKTYVLTTSGIQCYKTKNAE